ncbi:MAG TPA: AMP-binding protein [Streptosporangiaceae bacterium]|nr:AMP-binding protein [Streptosporangiaceae bacterium]
MTDVSIIPDLLRKRAAETPHATAAIVDGCGSLSYGEWDARSNAIARGLARYNVVAGDRVALFFENSEWIEFAVAYFAVLKAGAIAIPLSSRFTGPEVVAILERCGSSGVISGKTAPRGPGWQATVTQLERRQSSEPFGVGVMPEDIAEVLYTSGTTGLPKGVACRHLHVVTPLTQPAGGLPAWWRACAGGVYLHMNAVSTAAGQLRLFEPLGPAGLTTLALPVFDPDRFCRLAADYRAAVVQLVPAVAAAILDSGAWRRHDLSAVRVVSLGCAHVPVSVLRRLAIAFRAARLVNRYELSEARYAGTSLAYDGTRPASVGRPHGATQLMVTDDAGASLPAGVAGEIRLRWRGLRPQHYFRDAHATASVFMNGWTRTGDVGYLDDDGYLYLTDRLKDVIIKGGMNISTVEVEDTLRKHPRVADCAVFGIPSASHGEEVAAAIVSGHPLTLSDLRSFLGARLAAHKLPTHLLRLTELPRNRSGKVLKNDLRTRYAAGRQEPAATEEGFIRSGAARTRPVPHRPPRAG